MTTRGHRDQTCENIVRPMRHHGESPDEIPFSASMPRMHQRRPRRKSSAPNELWDCPALEVKNRVFDVFGTERREIHLRPRR